MLCSCLHAIYSHSEVFFIDLSNWTFSFILQASVQASDPLKKNLPYPTYTNFIILATSYPSVSFFSRDWDPPTHIQLQKSETYPWDFLGSPVVRTLCFHCRGPDSMSGQGNKVLRAACVILNTNGLAFITLFFIS